MTHFKAKHLHSAHPHIVQMSREEVQQHHDRECEGLKHVKGISSNKGPNVFSRLKLGMKNMFRREHTPSQKEIDAAVANVNKILLRTPENANFWVGVQSPRAPESVEMSTLTQTSTQASTLSLATSTTWDDSSRASSAAPQLPPFADFLASWDEEDSIDEGIDPWVDFSGIHIHESSSSSSTHTAEADNTAPTKDDTIPTIADIVSESEYAVGVPILRARARELTIVPARTASVSTRTASGSCSTEQLPRARPNILQRVHNQALVVQRHGRVDTLHSHPSRPNVLSSTRGRSPIVQDLSCLDYFPLPPPNTQWPLRAVDLPIIMITPATPPPGSASYMDGEEDQAPFLERSLYKAAAPIVPTIIVTPATPPPPVNFSRKRPAVLQEADW